MTDKKRITLSDETYEVAKFLFDARSENKLKKSFSIVDATSGGDDEQNFIITLGGSGDLPDFPLTLSALRDLEEFELIRMEPSGRGFEVRILPAFENFFDTDTSS